VRSWQLAPGVSVTAETSTPEARAMDVVFGRFAAPGDGARLTTEPLHGKVRVILDGVPLFTAAVDALAPVLEGALIGWAVRSQRDAAAFHAGCVAWGERAVLLVGDKGRGKSTLAAALGATASYLGDEVAFVRFSDGTMIPFPKAATLKQGSFDCFPARETWHDPVRGPVRYVMPDGEPGDAAISPALVVFPRWTAEASGATVELLDPERTALGLVRQTFGGLSRDARTLEVVTRLARLPAYTITYSTLDDATAAVAGLVAAAARGEA
jgi:hypothetical protein